MPRQARLDAAGALHHVICRGIERQAIVRDDVDRAAFVERLGDILGATGTRCYAWALLANHMHLLLRTGGVPLATVMRRVLTGYAGVFNPSPSPPRVSLPESLQIYPVPRGTVPARVGALSPPQSGAGRVGAGTSGRWTVTHGAAIAPCWATSHGRRQAVGEVLGRFGVRGAAARRAYRILSRMGVAQGRRPELAGGGLVRSAGGWKALTSRRRLGDRLHGDERILGDSDFVDTALAAAGEHLERRQHLRTRGRDFNWLVQRTAAAAGLPPGDLLTPEQDPGPRGTPEHALLFGSAGVGAAGCRDRVADRLGLSQPAVSRAVARGERLALAKGAAYRKRIIS